jgi:hypothetical protein
VIALQALKKYSVFGGAPMNPRDAQECSKGCCLYINGDSVSKDQFEKTIPQSDGRTRIPCFEGPQSELNKRVAKEVGSYIGYDISTVLSKQRYLYDPDNHKYLRDANPEDQTTWETTRKKAIEDIKKGQPT